MRVSLGMTNFSWPDPPAEAISRVAAAADDSAIDTLWVADHLIQADPTVPGTDVEMLEAMSTLGFLAAHTGRIRLGTMVAGVTFRPPALLIKAMTTIDVLSGGRVWFGLGAGHHQAEAAAMGLPFPGAADRLEQVEETVRLARQMWSGDRTRFAGRQFDLQEPQCEPGPVRSAGPPILIGGAGERRTLRLVAQYADACNVFDIPDDGATVRHKLAVLDRHCADVGREPGEVERTMSTRLGARETPEEFARRGGAAAQWGIEHLVAVMSAPWTPERVGALAEAADLLADVRPPSAN